MTDRESEINPFSGLLRPVVFNEFKISRFQDTQRIKTVGLSALRHGHL